MHHCFPLNVAGVARLPVPPGSKRPYKLTFIARTNAGWIGAAFDLLRHHVHSLAFEKSALVSMGSVLVVSVNTVS